MSSEVSIPEEAIERMVPLLTNVMTEGDAEDAAWDLARAAAPLILATDYEKTAKHLAKQAGVPNDEWDHGFQDGLKTAAAALLARASVLRGEGAE